MEKDRAGRAESGWAPPRGRLEGHRSPPPQPSLALQLPSMASGRRRRGLAVLGAGWGLKLGHLAEESSWEPPLWGVQGEGRQPKLFLHKNVGGESPD